MTTRFEEAYARLSEGERMSMLFMAWVVAQSVVTTILVIVAALTESDQAVVVLIMWVVAQCVVTPAFCTFILLKYVVSPPFPSLSGRRESRPPESGIG